MILIEPAASSRQEDIVRIAESERAGRIAVAASSDASSDCHIRSRIRVSSSIEAELHHSMRKLIYEPQISKSRDEYLGRIVIGIRSRVREACVAECTILGE